MATVQTERMHTVPGDPPIEVRIRRSKRARRFSLTVNRADGRARLSMPIWAAESEAIAFLSDREDWLRQHVASAPVLMRPMVGEQIPITGIDRPIIAGGGRSARFRAGSVEVPDDGRVGPRVKALLNNMARDVLLTAVDRHAGALGRPYGRISMRDTKSRWGSCSAKGDLMFSWRLIMAPPEILDYVAAHEVAHLVEMNHSDRFWHLCRQLCPETPIHRRWLREKGPELMRWRFDADTDSGS